MSLITPFIIVLLPFFSLFWRRMVVLFAGLLLEAFSTMPFGVMLATFFIALLVIEALLARVFPKEAGGWALAVFGGMATMAVGQAGALFAGTSIETLIIVSLLVSDLFVSGVVVGLLFFPVKLFI